MDVPLIQIKKFIKIYCIFRMSELNELNTVILEIQPGEWANLKLSAAEVGILIYLVIIWIFSLYIILFTQISMTQCFKVYSEKNL